MPYLAGEEALTYAFAANDFISTNLRTLHGEL